MSHCIVWLPLIGSVNFGNCSLLMEESDVVQVTANEPTDRTVQTFQPDQWIWAAQYDDSGYLLHSFTNHQAAEATEKARDMLQSIWARMQPKEGAA